MLTRKGVEPLSGGNWEFIPLPQDQWKSQTSSSTSTCPEWLPGEICKVKIDPRFNNQGCVAWVDKILHEMAERYLVNTQNSNSVKAHYMIDRPALRDAQRACRTARTQGKQRCLRPDM